MQKSIIDIVEKNESVYVNPLFSNECISIGDFQVDIQGKDSILVPDQASSLLKLYKRCPIRGLIYSNPNY